MASGSLGSGVLRNRSGSVPLSGRPAGQEIHLPLGRDDALCGLVQLLCRHIPAGDRTQHLRTLGIEVAQHAAQELAQDQRVHQRRAILRVDRVPHRVERRIPPIDLVREVHLVRAAAIVIRPPRAHRKPKRHRLQAARLVTGDLETLHLRRKRDAAVTDGGGGAPASLRQQLADRLLPPDQLDRLEQRLAVAKAQPTVRRATRVPRTPWQRRWCRQC
jgi:hypothetical protein